MELRVHRFRHVHDVSVLSEKVFSFIRMRQLLYFAFGILILWRAMSFRDPGAFMFSVFMFMLGAVSAIFSSGSCSFEARIALSILSIIDSLLTPKPGSAEKPREVRRKPSRTTTSITSTSSVVSSVGRMAKGKVLGAVTAVTGLTLFALSILTLFDLRMHATSPLARVLGTYGLWALAGTSVAVGGAGFFMFLCGVFGNPLRRRGKWGF